MQTVRGHRQTALRQPRFFGRRKGSACPSRERRPQGQRHQHDQHGHVSYNALVKTVNISSLKARLSAYLQSVRAGEEVLVCDRNKPVARIVPCCVSDFGDEEQRLVTRGVLTPPLKRRPSGAWPQPPGNVSDEVMEQVWREERERR